MVRSTNIPTIESDDDIEQNRKEKDEYTSDENTETDSIKKSNKRNKFNSNKRKKYNSGSETDSNSESEKKKKSKHSKKSDSDNDSTKKSESYKESDSESDRKKHKRSKKSNSSSDSKKKSKYSRQSNSGNNSAKEKSKLKSIKLELAKKTLKELKKYIEISKKKSKKLIKKLLPYQNAHVENLVKIIKKNKRALDLSDTGTGKTFCNIIACRLLKLRPFIICPKSMNRIWKKILKQLKCKHYGVANYEMIQGCKYYPPGSNKKKVCKYIKKKKLDESDSDDSDDTFSKNKKSKFFKGSSDYEWNLPEDCAVIFDEAHRCKNPKTQCSKLLQSVSKTDNHIILLSATIAESAKKFMVPGIVVGCYDTLRAGKNWIYDLTKDGKNEAIAIHDEIFPDKACRMKIKDLGDLFPKNQIFAECFDIDDCEAIQREYDSIRSETEALQRKEDSGTALAKIMACRQRIELLKVPFFVEEAKKFMEEGNSVVIFTNFKATLELLAEKLDTNSVLHGDLTEDERERTIERFQKDKSHIIICNIQATKEGISLHDIRGERPRVALFNVTWSAQNLKQGLGRIYRAGAKSPARQYIIFADKTYEKDICESMKIKLENIANLNDADLSSVKIEGLIENEFSEKPDENAKKRKGSNNSNKKLSDFEIAFKKLTDLNSKKEELEKELNKINNQITQARLIVDQSVGGDDMSD